MIRSRIAAPILLTTALCCAGCASSLFATDPAAHELEVVELSEAQMQHGGFGSAGAKPTDSSAKPTPDGNSAGASKPENAANMATGGEKPIANSAAPAIAITAAPKETVAAGQQFTAAPGSAAQNASSQDSVNGASAAKQIDSRQMLALLADLQSAGAIDAKTQQELLDDLKQTDPALWPQLIRQFRTAIAYRQHMAAALPGATPPSAALPVALPTAGTPAAVPTTSTVPAGIVPVVAESQLDPLAAMFNQTQTSAAKSVGSLTSPGAALLGPSIAGAPPGAAAAMIAQSRLQDNVAATDSAPPANVADAASPPPLASKTSLPANPVQQASKTVDSPTDHGGKTNLAPRPRKAAAATASKTAAPNAASTATDEWQQGLTESILAAESQAAGGQGTPAEFDRQLRLRFMYLAAGRRDDALRPVAGMPPEQQEFWTKELYGLGTYLDTQRIADPERRATEAALHLHEAAGRLGELASPVVHNLTFCKEVTSYGVFKRFPKYEFKPAEEVLLYCEIENLRSQSTDLGYHTNIKSSYQILDSRGERVSEQEFPPSDDYCSNPRRDFFIPYFIALPKRINPGNYTLQLTIEDTQRNKVGQSSIQFSVK